MAGVDEIETLFTLDACHDHAELDARGAAGDVGAEELEQPSRIPVTPHRIGIIVHVARHIPVVHRRGAVLIRQNGSNLHPL